MIEYNNQVGSESYLNFLGVLISKSSQVTDLCYYLSDTLISDSYQELFVQIYPHVVFGQI